MPSLQWLPRTSTDPPAAAEPTWPLHDHFEPDAGEAARKIATGLYAAFATQPPEAQPRVPLPGEPEAHATARLAAGAETDQPDATPREKAEPDRGPQRGPDAGGSAAEPQPDARGGRAR